MNKFDKEFNKIINQQNLTEYIASEGIKETFSDIWDSITSIGQSISKAISKGTTWSLKKIKLVLEKMWNFITPENTQQTLKNVKSLTKIMPSQMAQKTNKILQISGSQQCKSYINKKIINEYKSIDNFNKVSNSEQKEFISKISQSYLSENNIISQEIVKQIAPAVGAALVTVGLPMAASAIACLFKLGILAWLYFEVKKLLKASNILPKTPEEIAQQERNVALIKQQQEKNKIEHQKWKDKELREKLYQQIINVKEFQG